MNHNLLWECVIPGTPRQKGNSKTARYSKGAGRAWVVPDARTVEAQNAAKALAWAQRPPELLSCVSEPLALSVSYVFAFTIPASRRKGKRALVEGAPHTQRPDLGNLEKMADDVLEGIAFENDCVIAERERSRKVWTMGPSETRVVVRRLGHS